MLESIIPTRTPALLTRLYPELVWRIAAEEPTIYLTFDDGPDPAATAYVLEQLDAYEACATFFCLGSQVQHNEGLFNKLIASRHDVGNHTFDHLNGWNTPTEVYLDNVSSCSKFVDSKLFRPPFGRITKAQIRALKDQFTIVMWDLLAFDWREDLNYARQLAQLKSKTRKGSIVVFHDSEQALENLKQLLPPYLEFLKSQGYQFGLIPK